MPKHKRFGDDEKFDDNIELENEGEEDESSAPFKGDITLEFSDSDEAPESISLGVGKERALQQIKEEKDVSKRFVIFTILVFHENFLCNVGVNNLRKKRGKSLVL